MFVYPWIFALKTKLNSPPKNVATGRMSNLKSYESIMAFVAMQNCWQVKAIKVLPRSSFFLIFSHLTVLNLIALVWAFLRESLKSIGIQSEIKSQARVIKS